ncbi:MAG: TlpA family protein disulfide reductase [Hyphomicrobiaceae bacterium]|nr:TlpA family protein disulfide reductase [Hyphomicrobiaceae bacterium]
MALGAAGLAAIAGFASVYVTLGRPDNAPVPAAQASAVETAKPSAAPSGPGSNALSQGQMAAFVFRAARQDLPEVKFEDAMGKERTLADWKGKVVLLNLWATWCLPCRKEMPALDRLQQELGSEAFEVVALSVDRTGRTGARKFLDEAKVAKLALYADPSARMASTLRAAGLPATLLIDREGREIGRLLGPAQWDGEDARRLIRWALKG